jgi:tachylectin
VISGIYSGFTCAHTPPAPGAPGALDPPKLTGFPGTSGDGAIGGATPFKLLVEWRRSSKSSSNLGWYTVEMWQDKRWVPVQRVEIARLENEDAPEVVLTGGDPADRRFVRVCADNPVARSCSKEGIYYGKLKPNLATPAAGAERYSALITHPGPGPTVTANRSAAVRVPAPANSGISAQTRAGALSTVIGAASGIPPAPSAPIGPAPAVTAFYVIDGAGGFMRYTHDMPETGTVPAVSVAAASGWDAYRDVIPAGANHFYARTANGDLLWFEHDPSVDPSAAWKGPIVVARGWQEFTQIIGGGNGVIYAIAADGAIVWYRHGGFASGNPGGWSAPNKLADGWGNFKFIFAGGAGVLYSVTQDNRLMANRHLDPINGAAAWSKPVQVGNGWGAFAQLFSAGNGVIYGLSTDGKLSYYRHLTWNAATPTFKWVGPVAAGEGFDPAAKIVPVMP